MKEEPNARKSLSVNTCKLSSYNLFSFSSIVVDLSYIKLSVYSFKKCFVFGKSGGM